MHFINTLSKFIVFNPFNYKLINLFWKTSKTQWEYAKYINNVQVFINPSLFLGPNYKAVLDFWNRLDELTEDQWRNINRLYKDFRFGKKTCSDMCHDNVLTVSFKKIGNYAGDIVFATVAVWGDSDACYVVYYATLEIIGSIQNQHFIPMFDNS